jgi:hypothetical protein
VNAEPDTEAALSVKLGPPLGAELVNEIEIALLLPTATLPKFRVLLLRVTVDVNGVLEGFDDVAPPPQDRIAAAANSTKPKFRTGACSVEGKGTAPLVCWNSSPHKESEVHVPRRSLSAILR